MTLLGLDSSKTVKSVSWQTLTSSFANTAVVVPDVGVQVDSDADGVYDYLDIDSDNDGITDNVEAQSTADYIAPTGDGVIADVNSNGLDDVYEGATTGISAGGLGLETVDTDSDGIVDYLDTDSDNDGTSDAIEAGHGVSQALIDATADTDGDGLQDAVEGGNNDDGFDVNDENVDILGEFTLEDSDSDVDPGRANADPLNIDYDFREALDTDGDNVHDAQDIDDDNDGILDVLEGAPVPLLNPSFEADGRVTAGGLSGWSFGGGNIDTRENQFATDGLYAIDLNGTAPATIFQDVVTVPGRTYTLSFDYAANAQTATQIREFRASAIDQTSSAEIESAVFSTLGPLATSIPGSITFTATSTSTRIQFQSLTAGSGGNWLDNINLTDFTADTDGDGIFNHLDIDSDNDGITDNVEAQTTADYITPSGIGGTAAFIDENNDGLDDNYDNTAVAGMASGATGVGLTPVDTDSDGIADYLDLDSDNDGIEDAAERGTAGSTTAQTGVVSDATTDADGDGLLDEFEGSDDSDGFDVNDENRDATSIALADTDGDLNGVDGSNAIALNIDSDFREALDTDGDNVHDAQDIDDDNDGILDAVERYDRTFVNGTSGTAPIGVFTVDGDSNRAVLTSTSGTPTGRAVGFGFREEAAVGAVHRITFDDAVDTVDLLFSSVNNQTRIGNFTVVYDDGTSVANVDLQVTDTDHFPSNPNSFHLLQRITVGTTIGLDNTTNVSTCLLYTSPSPRDQRGSRMPSSA